jgi:hypothetical protein
MPVAGFQKKINNSIDAGKKSDEFNKIIGKCATEQIKKKFGQ